MVKESNIDFNSVPDKDLFFYMACTEEDSVTADVAFNEFYSRYKAYTFHICRNRFLSRRQFDEEDLKSFFHNVFLKIYEKSDTISFDNQIPDQEIEYAIKAMIGSFVEFEAKEYFRVRGNENLQIDYSDEDQDLITMEKSDSVQSIESKVLDKALDTLPEKSRLILLELFRYDDDGKNTPSRVLDELCKYFDTTKPTLRKTKERALKKVKEYIEQSETLKLTK